MNFRNSFHPYAIVSISGWALAHIFSRLALQYFSGVGLGFLRYFVASCVLIAVAVAYKMQPPCKKDIPWFAAAGAAGFFLYMLFYNKGQAMVTAATGSVVIATVPVLTALMASFIYREKLRPHQWAAIVIEFAGVAVLTLMQGAISVNSGLLWMFIAAILLALYNLVQRRLIKTYTSLQTSAYSIFAGTVMLSIFAPIGFKEIIAAPTIQFLYLAVLGIFSSAIAYVSWARALSMAKKTSQVSNYMFLTPFVVSILGIVIAGEVPDRATIIGGSIILEGVFIFNFGGRLFAGAGAKS